MILFETTESVIEVLWDIVLAIYIVRIAFTYFLLNFLSGLIFVYLAYTPPITHLTTPQSELAMIPFLLLGSVVWARAVITYNEIPRVVGFRLAAGMVAVVFMVVAEMGTALVLYEGGMGGWIWEMDSGVGWAFGGLLGAYGFMLVGLMVFEGGEEEGGRVGGGRHGHGGKRIGDAVPTVNMSGKKEKKMQ